MTSTLGRIVGDLLCIEVDVTVADELRGTFDASSAARGVLENYRSWLAAHVDELNTAWAAFVPSDAAAGPMATSPGSLARVSRQGALIDGLRLMRAQQDRGAALYEQFRAVARDAATGEEMCRVLSSAGALPDPRTAHLFRRIRGNSEQLHALGVSDGAPSVEHALVLRKAWELGTDRIVAQAIAQVDGDIVVRLDEALLTPQSEPLMALHHHALANGLTHWRTLVEFLAQLTIGGAGILAALRGFFRSPRAAVRAWRQARSRTAATSEVSALRLWLPSELARTVAAFIELRRALLVSGGTTIESTADGGAVYARTVLQPDGDGVWIVSRRAASDQARLDAHARRVAESSERLTALVARMRRYLSGVQALASTASALVGAVLTATGRGGCWLLIGAVSMIGAVPLVRAIAGRLLRCRIRWMPT